MSDSMDTSILLEVHNCSSVTLPNDQSIILSAPRSDMSPSDTPFTEVTQLISYNWADQKNVNLIALHWSKPIVAYVINTEYHKTFGSLSKETPKPLDQNVRLVNYETNSRALAKPMALDSIVDIAFSCGQTSASELLATLDKSSMINIFVFREFSSPVQSQLEIHKVLTIRPNLPLSFELKNCQNFALSWCPYISSDELKSSDPSLRLVVTYGSTLEVFSFDESRHFKGKDFILERNDMKKELEGYLCYPNAHHGAVKSASLSNDGSLISTAGTDNKLRFFQIEDDSEGSAPSLKTVREWLPHIQPPDTISAAFYLDDYNFLLNHPEHMFWGYILIGSADGVMKIYDLQSWTVTRAITIECVKDDDFDTDNSEFKYFIDKSSSAVLAVKGDIVFIFIIEFIDEVTDSSDGQGVVRSPRFTQVGRFSLYNPVISFQITKSASDNAIDIFWMTLKSLEKCTVNIEKLAECSSTADVIAIKVPNPNSSASKARQIHKVTPSTNVSMVSCNEAFGDGTSASSSILALFNDQSPSRPTAPIAPGNSSTLNSSQSDRELEIINRIRNSDEEINNLRRKQGTDTTPNKHQPSPIGTKVIEPKRQSKAGVASARVMSMINNGSISVASCRGSPNLPQVNPLSASSPEQAQFFSQLQQQQQQQQQQVLHLQNQPANAARSTPSVPFILPPSSTSMPPQLNDLAKFMLIENNLKSLESKMLHEMQNLNTSMNSTLKRVERELHSLKQEQSNLSKERSSSDRAIMETTINRVVDLSMSQLNLVVSKGLKDFFDQTKVGINHLESAVHTVKDDFDKIMQENSKKMSFIQNQLDIFQKQLEKSEAEQQLILLRIQQIATLYK